MCGLTGVISSYLSSGEVETFQHLALAAVMRGKIGGGVAVVPLNSKKEIKIIKHPRSLAHVVLEPDFANLVFSTKPNRSCLIMGHARAPTRGGRTDDDIHPHRVGHIIGMHNGTFETVGNTKVKDRDNDSALFFDHVAADGIEIAVKYAKGAYALSWINTKTETIHFLRNTERTLFFGHYQGDNGTWFWHSEADMLNSILLRERADISDQPVIIPLQPNQLVTLRIRNSGTIRPIGIRPVNSHTEPSKTTVPSVSQTPHLLPAPSHSAAAPSWQQEDDQLYGKTGTLLLPDRSSFSRTLPMVQTQPGVWIAMGELESLLYEGCAVCRKPATQDDHRRSKISWYKRKEFMCEACANTEFGRDYMKLEGHTHH